MDPTVKNPSVSPSVDLEKVAAENLIPRGDRWFTDLCSADDIHSLLKLAVGDMDRLIYGIYQRRNEESMPWHDIVMPVGSQLQHCGYQAVCAGREYASEFSTDHVKTGQALDWDYTVDIDQMISGLGYPATTKTMDIVHQALAGGEAPPVHELSQLIEYDQAKAIARTVMLNIYVKASLRKWDEDGITRVKRLEMRDKKTCPICKALNGKEYEIADIINLVYPLTNDSHPSCRGTFIPLISLDTYDPKQREIPLSVEFSIGNNKATNVPMEVKPWLYSFLKKFNGPIHVDFDPTIKDSYTWAPFEVTINPDALTDEDPREIILYSVADQLWPHFQKKFEVEYVPLIKSGLARPAKSFSTNRELFIQNYTAHRMGQDEDVFSNAWWAENVK
jgi:SPP1 gp7 family putative phage head morphogenesis protein